MTVLELQSISKMNPQNYVKSVEITPSEGQHLFEYLAWVTKISLKLANCQVKHCPISDLLFKNSNSKVRTALNR